MTRMKAGFAYIGVTAWVTLIEVDAIGRWVADEPIWLTKPGTVLLGLVCIGMLAGMYSVLRTAFTEDDESY